MPKPCSLVETKGWNRRVADEVGGHAVAAVDHLDRDVAAAFEEAELDRLVRPGWRRSRSGRDGRAPARAPAGSAMATSAGLAGDADRVGAALGGGDRVEQRLRSRPARGGSASRAAPGERRASRSFILLHRALQGRDHVGAEFGIVGVALGVAGDEAELAHQILDVVHDEGEAAVELVEALRVGERLLAARLGDIGGGLDAGGAEQVEILPVERGGGSPDARG